MIKTTLLNFMNCSCCFKTRQERSLKTTWELFERRLCLQYIKNNGKDTLCVDMYIYSYVFTELKKNCVLRTDHVIKSSWRSFKKVIPIGMTLVRGGTNKNLTKLLDMI